MGVQLAQLHESGVVVGGLLVGKEDTDTGFQEKTAQYGFVDGPWLPTANGAQSPSIDEFNF